MSENAGHPSHHPSYPSCFDPYLRYGIRTHFADFKFFDDKLFKLFFLVEFKEPALADEFAEQMGAAGFAVQLDPILEGEQTRYRTLHSQKSAVTDHRTFPYWEKYVDRVELSLPLKPNPSPPPDHAIPFFVQPRWSSVAQPPGALLIGVLDDGCPFAAAQFMRSSSSTRILAIWDQNPNKAPAHIKDTAGNDFVFGMPLLDFGYGLEYWRDFAVSGNTTPQQIGIDKWISLHLTPAQTIDEEHSYSDACFDSLAFRESHGAHVMDVLVGNIPPSSRIGPTGSNTDHRDPPSWAPATDPASDADVVFVQFPKSGILDASGIWLKAYVIAGIEYILSFAGPQTRNVIINLSYGPATGPHDGTAVLEEALSALVAYYDGVTNQPKLDIFLAAGNFYLTDTHVAYRRHQGHSPSIQWTWRLLPDNPVTCFSEVWMDSNQAGGVTVTLTPPGGAPLVINPQILGNNTMWQLNVAPTLIAPKVAAAPHGDYTIKVVGIPQYAQVDAYAARTDPNLGVISLAKRSYFVDPSWERTRSAAADCRYVHGEFDDRGSLIKRTGTLNGIATANVRPVHVAGGDMIAMGDGRKSPYASAGPARGSPATRRIGPDYALFTDESYALEGVRAGGSRSGAVFRLIGTSAAAPQLARLIADMASLQVDFPTTTVQEKEQRGEGDVEPP
jgi:hypothetical protein